MKIANEDGQHWWAGCRRALTHPVGLAVVGAGAYWVPFFGWLLLPRWLVQQPDPLDHWSFIFLAPGVVWVVMYYWYRSVIPPAHRTIGPAIWMGIVGPLISAWLLASVFVLITETQNDRFIISFNEIAGIFLEGFSVVAVVFSPYWIAVLGSGLVGFMLSRHFRKSSGGRNE